MAFKAAPLSSGFMLVSMFGFIASILVIMKFSGPWGITFALIFALMFIASMVSMTHAPSLSALDITFRKKPAKTIKKKKD